MDRIIYQVISKGGGIDGRDSSDKSKVLFASLSRSEAENKVDAYSFLKLVAMSDEEISVIASRAMQKIDGMEILAISIGNKL